MGELKLKVTGSEVRFVNPSHPRTTHINLTTYPLEESKLDQHRKVVLKLTLEGLKKMIPFDDRTIQDIDFILSKHLLPFTQWEKQLQKIYDFTMGYVHGKEAKLYFHHLLTLEKSHLAFIIKNVELEGKSTVWVLEPVNGKHLHYSPIDVLLTLKDLRTLIPFDKETQKIVDKAIETDSYPQDQEFKKFYDFVSKYCKNKQVNLSQFE